MHVRYCSLAGKRIPLKTIHKIVSSAELCQGFKFCDTDRVLIMWFTLHGTAQNIVSLIVNTVKPLKNYQITIKMAYHAVPSLICGSLCSH